jgi:hypothetical protein
MAFAATGNRGERLQDTAIMSGSIKDFGALKSMRAAIKAQEEARKAEEAERLRREQESRRDADLFRRSIGEVAPLPSPDKMLPDMPRP